MTNISEYLPVGSISSLAAETKNAVQKAGARTVAIVGLPLMAILVVILTWFGMEQKWRARAARKYVNSLRVITNTPEKERPAKLEEMFKKSKNLTNKAYFGMKLIQEHYKQNPQKAISVAKQIIGMSGVPGYIVEATKIKLAYIYADLLRDMSKNKNLGDLSQITEGDIEPYIVASDKNSPLYPMVKEASLEVMLAKGETEQYISGAKELQKIKDLPESIRVRLATNIQEIQSITQAT